MNEGATRPAPVMRRAFPRTLLHGFLRHCETLDPKHVARRASRYTLPLPRTDRILAATCLAILACATPTAGSNARSVRAQVGVARPDLVVSAIDRTALVEDIGSGDVSGAVHVALRNQGAGVAEQVVVTVYADGDGDGSIDPRIDARLGGANGSRLAPGSDATVLVPIAGRLRLRGARLLAVASTIGGAADVDATNDARLSSAVCMRRARPARPAPRLEWAWRSSDIEAESVHVIGVPAVADVDADGRPEVSFVTFEAKSFNAEDHKANGVLRILDGRTGAERAAVSDPALRLRPNVGVAAVDLEGDGRAEIIGLAEDAQSVLAFRGDGSLVWRSAPFGAWHAGAITVADLEGDGRPEIIVGVTVIEADGSIRWSRDQAGLAGLSRGAGKLQAVVSTADVDLDGRLEIVAGPTVFRSDGSVLWRSDVVDEAFSVPINLDDDPFPEFALVRLGALYALDHDGTRLWGPVALAGGAVNNGGGPPAVADLDGDGVPEIVVADRIALAAYHADGGLRWTLPIRDATSKSTSVSLFDFEGDGIPEVVHGDESVLRIVRGIDGGEWWQTASSNGTQVELPVIADVDADGHAEIVRVVNSYTTGRSQGVEVYGMDEAWLGAPPVWNQHAYTAGAAGAAARVPAVTAPSWLAHNTVRVAPTLLDALFDLDASAGRLRLERGEDGGVQLRATLGSVGLRPLPPGSRLLFSLVREDGSESPLGSSNETGAAFAPGAGVQLWAPWPSGAARTGAVGGETQRIAVRTFVPGRTRDCDPTNDRSVVELPWPSDSVPSPTLAPTPRPTPRSTATPGATRIWWLHLPLVRRIRLPGTT